MEKDLAGNTVTKRAVPCTGSVLGLIDRCKPKRLQCELIKKTSTPHRLNLMRYGVGKNAYFVLAFLLNKILKVNFSAGKYAAG